MPAVASGGRVRTYGAVGGASSQATLLTASGTANAKGTAVELVAATELDAHWLLVQLSDASATDNYRVDILAGAATEAVIVPDLYARPRSVGADWGPYLLPVFVPRGTRLSARCACTTGGGAIRVAVTLIGPGPASFGSPPTGVVSCYGTNTAGLGVNVDPGATANTDSAWVQITAATERDHHWLVIGGRFGDLVLGATTLWRLSLGIGAATEDVIIPDLHFSADNTIDATFSPVVTIPLFVSRGSRLTARARCNVTSDNDRDIHLNVWGA